MSKIGWQFIPNILATKPKGYMSPCEFITFSFSNETHLRIEELLVEKCRLPCNGIKYYFLILKILSQFSPEKKRRNIELVGVSVSKQNNLSKY